jgi:hypothetical protein
VVIEIERRLHRYTLRPRPAIIQGSPVRIAPLALVLCAIVLAGPGRGGEPDAAALAAQASERAFGGNAVEVWKSEWQNLSLSYGVARHWTGGKVEVFVRVFEPHKYDPLSFLLKEREDGAPGIEYFRSPKLFGMDAKSGRMLDVVLASPLERLPFAPGLPALVDIWPPRASDFQLARLPDRESDGKPCRVLEQRLLHGAGDYDRIVTLLARDSGLALETQYLRGERLVRRVTVLASDIEQSDDRPIVRRRTVERPGEADQIFTLENVNLDPVLPDQLFTSSNLRAGRFPSY